MPIEPLHERCRTAAEGLENTIARYALYETAARCYRGTGRPGATGAKVSEDVLGICADALEELQRQQPVFYYAGCWADLVRLCRGDYFLLSGFRLPRRRRKLDSLDAGGALVWQLRQDLSARGELARTAEQFADAVRQKMPWVVRANALAAYGELQQKNNFAALEQLFAIDEAPADQPF